MVTVDNSQVVLYIRLDIILGFITSVIPDAKRTPVSQAHNVLDIIHDSFVSAAPGLAFVRRRNPETKNPFRVNV